MVLLTPLELSGQTLCPTEVLPLLKRYQLLSVLEQELRLDQAIAPIPCTPEETAEARQRFFAAHQLPADAAEVALCDRYQVTPPELDGRPPCRPTDHCPKRHRARRLRTKL